MKIIKNRKPIFMVHKHHATKLHYDLRLEIEGKLKSFAMYELPIKPSEPVNAVQVPDHPFWYRHFEGVIPEGDYGAGPVMVWDKGLFTSFMKDHDGKAISLEESIKHGFMLLWLEGHKLNGGYILVRLSKKAKWLIIKMDDEYVIKGRKPAKSSKIFSMKQLILENYCFIANQFSIINTSRIAIYLKKGTSYEKIAYFHNWAFYTINRRFFSNT